MHTVCSHRPAFFFFLMIRRPPRSTRTDTLFPTRRSSDLSLRDRGSRHRRSMPRRSSTDRAGGSRRERCSSCAAHRGRSEEHTSELQSLMRISYAVFCLKKKKILRKLLFNTYMNNLFLILYSETTSNTHQHTLYLHYITLHISPLYTNYI